MNDMKTSNIQYWKFKHCSFDLPKRYTILHLTQCPRIKVPVRDIDFRFFKYFAME